MSMIGSNDKLKQAAAGAAGGGGPLDVDDVFSTYVYEGNNSTQTITNGIDLAGEGGMIWTKARELVRDHKIIDTARPINRTLTPNSTNAQDASSGVTSITSTGYTLDSNAFFNTGTSYVSWTFRKAPKFFDVVTYTGNSGTNVISHGLNQTVGCVFIKRTSASDDWMVYHRGTSDPNNKYLVLNTNAAEANFSNWMATTDTSFTVTGANGLINNSGETYVAYLFAHNDGDGEFGPDGDADIIKCGSVVADGSGNATVDLGFEPQWLMVKNATSSGYDWQIFDTMRGFKASPDNDSPALFANTSGAESGQGDPNITSTGFTWDGGGAAPNNTYIYMAIRRGPLAPPESATDVFAVVGGGFPATSGFPVDSVLSTYFETYANNHMLYDRLRATDGSRLLFTHSNAAENTSNPFSLSIASNTGVERSWGSGWNHKMFRRAPGFFDVVAYTGAGSNQTLKHNLTVKPELSIVKYRTGSYSISAYTSWGTNTLTDGTNNPTLFLDTDRATIGSTNAYWQEATDTEIYVGGANNENSFTYIMYLFATLAGISKVGKYTGNGSSQTINCGFTSGARYVLIKRYDSAGDWYVWDTARGIVAGNDPYMRLNVTTGEVTSNDSIDPASSGFIVNQVAATNINVSGAKYAYYSVA